MYWSDTDTLYLKFKPEDIVQCWGSSEDLPSVFEAYSENKFTLSNVDYFDMYCGFVASSISVRGFIRDILVCNV